MLRTDIFVHGKYFLTVSLCAGRGRGGGGDAARDERRPHGDRAAALRGGGGGEHGGVQADAQDRAHGALQPHDQDTGQPRHHTVGAVRNETLVFVNFSAQDASILKISVPIIKRRS